MAVTEHFVPPPHAARVLDSSFVAANHWADVIDLELHEPMALSFGRIESRPSGWLELECLIGGAPQVGYGEGATLPEAVFTDDSGHNIARNIGALARKLATQEGLTVATALELVQTHEFATGGRFPTARLAAEMAILDAATKAYDMPMAAFLGLPEDLQSVPFGQSIGHHTVEGIMEQVDSAMEHNAQKIKLKVSPELFDTVAAAIAAIREKYPQVGIMVDANGGFDPQNSLHLVMLAHLDVMGLLMIEEPVSRVGKLRGLDAVREMHRRSPIADTPICLDDCLATVGDCHTAIEEGLAHVINIKPGRIGSFMKSLDLVKFAAAHDVQVMVGGMLEGTPGRCMTTLLGAFCLHNGFTVPGDLSLAQERLSSDLVAPESQLRLNDAGEIVLPRTKGWGF
jgi:O-succinylbenzoate synthase